MKVCKCDKCKVIVEKDSYYVITVTRSEFDSGHDHYHSGSVTEVELCSKCFKELFMSTGMLKQINDKLDATSNAIGPWIPPHGPHSYRHRPIG